MLHNVSRIRLVAFAAAGLLATGSNQVRAGTAPRQLAAAPVSGAQQAGKSIYGANCAVCHGEGGSGGIGPSLQGIGSRLSLDQTVAFIEQPVGPMPKLYPAKLTGAQVRQVATYIRSAFAAPSNASAGPGGYPMRPGMMGGYGPGGYGQAARNGTPAALHLSVDDVRRYFERWLRAEGNPHVKLGSVRVKDANTIVAAIVTTSGNSLVERYEVDRRTGYISPER